MSDRGPFTMDHDPGRRKIERLAREYLSACRQLADRQMAGKPTFNAGGVPGACVHERSAVSVAAQAIWCAAAADAGYAPFNVVDGFAHALAAIFAQGGPEGAEAAIQLLVMNLRGYEGRTRASFTPPNRAPDA